MFKLREKFGVIIVWRESVRESEWQSIYIYIQRHTVKERDELRGGESVVFTESGELVVVVLLREVSVCVREREREGEGEGKW